MSSVSSVYFYDHSQPVVDYRQEVKAGLKASEKYISPKFFYDERGSQLFTQIPQQTEYYLTVTVTRLLQSLM